MDANGCKLMRCYIMPHNAVDESNTCNVEYLGIKYINFNILDQIDQYKSVLVCVKVKVKSAAELSGPSGQSLSWFL